MYKANSWLRNRVIFLIVSIAVTLNGCKYVSGLEGNYRIVATASGEVIGIGESNDTISMQTASDTIKMQQA